MRKLLVGMIALMLLCVPALAEVWATGDVNLRTGPGLDYGTAGSVPSGVSMEYLGETVADARGVEWYKVRVDGFEVWVSSKYTEVVEEIVAYDPDAECVELSDYYSAPLVESAAEARLKNYRELPSEAPKQYYNEGAVLAGWDFVEHIEVNGPGYALFGVATGMSAEEARARMLETLLDLWRDDALCIVFEHRSDENSLVDVDGHDSCINIWLQDGIVTQVDWSTYTG